MGPFGTETYMSSPGWIRRICTQVLLLLLVVTLLTSATGSSGWLVGTAGAERSLAWAKPDQTANAVSHSTATGPLGGHYLMLVNTAISWMMTPQKMAEFEKSPYDGLAVAFWHAYDTSSVVSIPDMDAQIAGWKKITKKDIWPWVYINRMIAANDAENNAHANEPYFHRFKGADLDGQAGAQADFLENWKNSLHAAKDTGAPGVVFDFEFYNNYKEYDPGEMASQTGKSPEQVVVLLRGIGAKMADIAAIQYPKATLWFLATGFTHPGYKTSNKQPY